MRSSDPAVVLAALDREAARFETPAGVGSVVWRRWGDGRPLLLLHGGSGSWTHWVRNILPLARTRMVMVPDMPGFGDSADALPSAQRFDLDGGIATMAGALAEGTRMLLADMPKLDICGFSFGGIIGSKVALLLGRQVEHLVVVGSEGLGAPRTPLAPLRSLRGLTGAELHMAARQNLNTLMVADAEEIDDLAVRIYLANVARTKFFASKQTSGTRVLYDTLSQLDGIRICGIWGERDGLASPYLAERRDRLAALRTPAQFHIIPAAGHWVIYEAAEAFNALLLSLLPGTESNDAPREGPR